MIQAGFFGGIFDFVAHPVDSSIAMLALLLVGWACRRWLMPFLDTALKNKVAEYALLIADDVTDDMVARYPDNKFWDIIDKSVDKIMEICGVSEETAKRVAGASLKRKGIEDKRKK